MSLICFRLLAIPSTCPTHVLLDALEIERLVKVLVRKLGLLEHLVIEFALEFHDQEKHVIVGPAREQNPTRSATSCVSRRPSRRVSSRPLWRFRLTFPCTARIMCIRSTTYQVNSRKAGQGLHTAPINISHEWLRPRRSLDYSLISGAR